MSEFKNCPFCHKLISFDAKYCKHCGAQFDVENQQEEKKQVIDNSATIILLGALICILCTCQFARDVFTSDLAFFSKQEAAQKSSNNISDKNAKNLVLLTKLGFTLRPMDKETMRYLKKKGYDTKVPNGKKLVIYAHIDNPPAEEETFIKAINGYESTSGWNDQYTFVEEYRPNDMRLSTNKKEAEQAVDFMNKCGTFCVIDFKNNRWYYSNKLSTSSLYFALYSFYNE